jgi:tetratricopeptide (TPR) repeat protein
LRAYQQAQAELEKLIDRDPKAQRCRANLAAILGSIGNVEANRNRPTEAQRSYRLARKIFAELIDAEPTNLAFLRQLALTEHNLSMVEAPAEKLAVLNSARAHRERAVALAPDAMRLSTRHDVARTDEILAVVLWSLGQRTEAIERLQQAAATLEEVVLRDPHVAQFRRSLAETYLNLGGYYGELKRFSEALATLEKARAALEDVLHREPTNSVARDELSMVFQKISEAYQASERPVEAAAAALEIKRRFPSDPAQLYRSACELARCIPLVGKDKTVFNIREQSLRREYTEQAIATLEEAVSHGYKDLGELKKSSDLAVLHPSEKFQKLLTCLAAKATAK